MFLINSPTPNIDAKTSNSRMIPVLGILLRLPKVSVPSLIADITLVSCIVSFNRSWILSLGKKRNSLEAEANAAIGGRGSASARGRE